MAQVLSFDFLALHHIYYSEIMLLFYGDFVVQNTVFLQYFLRHDIDARASKDFKEASDYFTSRKVSESGSHTDNNADSRVDQL
ncbi:hypothetical protein ACSLNT_30015, partial [Escherichia coli]|uniref:hypothetical protein n=1 Tax=Escherichia coli TaxID=562 RepID=UPI003EDF8D68